MHGFQHRDRICSSCRQGFEDDCCGHNESDGTDPDDNDADMCSQVTKFTKQKC